MIRRRAFTLSLLSLPFSLAVDIDFVDKGGIGSDGHRRPGSAIQNRDLFNDLLANLSSGDRLIFPKGYMFDMMGGVFGEGLTNVTIVFDAAIVFSRDIKKWPCCRLNIDCNHIEECGSWPASKKKNLKVLPCIRFRNPSHVTFTSTNGEHGGLIDGSGSVWWGVPGIGYLTRGENRPRLFVLESSEHVLFENIVLKNSPYWSFWAPKSFHLEVRHSSVDVRRAQNAEYHSPYELTAFNTDGFDVTGQYVWIHHVKIWNQDDCIAVKGNSRDMLFEDIEASGLGLTIGSIGPDSYVRNITFRNCAMSNSIKGVYMKFSRHANHKSIIQDILYENITMENPKRPIWIGPAQQSDTSDLCAAHTCSICWPQLFFAKCHASNAGANYSNIVLKNLKIKNPQQKAIIIGNKETPIRNLTLDGVVVQNLIEEGTHLLQKIKKIEKKGFGYYCEGVDLASLNTSKCSPKPTCFRNKTDLPVSEWDALEAGDSQQTLMLDRTEL